MVPVLRQDFIVGWPNRATPLGDRSRKERPSWPAVIGIKALTDEGISIAVYQSLVERFRAERIELSVPGQLRMVGGTPQAA
jgi:hypothetical protein